MLGSGWLVLIPLRTIGNYPAITIGEQNDEKAKQVGMYRYRANGRVCWFCFLSDCSCLFDLFLNPNQRGIKMSMDFKLENVGLGAVSEKFDDELMKVIDNIRAYLKDYLPDVAVIA